MTLLEPSVALTDFALAIECACFVIWLNRYRTDRFGLAFIILFAATGFAATLGGISHGFLGDTRTFAARLVWMATLITISFAAFASWIVGARLLLPARLEKIVLILAGVVFAAQSLYILLVSQSFAVAIASYAPAALFLLIAFSLAYRRHRAPFLLPGILGLTLTFAAAAIQQMAIGLHPLYFDHNALYHLIQGLALFLIFLAARGLVKSRVM